MPELRPHDTIPAPDPPVPEGSARSRPHVDTGGQGLVRRFLAVTRHFWALVAGGALARVRALPRRGRNRPGRLLLRAITAVLALQVNRKLKREPFPVQLRSRFERLGPTYIKLGQILSMREDVLPKAVTDELKNLLDRLPAVPYPEFMDRVTRHLGRPVDEVFAHIRTRPLGSASIGQTHLATLHSGEQVILKVVKPGIRQTLRRDTRLLRLLGRILDLFLPR